MSKKKTVIIILCVCLGLLAAGVGGVLAYRTHYNNTHIFLDGQVYDKDAVQVDLRGTGASLEHYQALCRELPQAEVLWELPFQGGYLPLDTKELTLTTLTQDEIALLDHLTQLERVDATACRDYEQILALLVRRPQCEVDYCVELEGKTYPKDVQELSFPDADGIQLLERLAWLPDVRSVTIDMPTMPARDLLALVEAYPNIHFSWNVDVMGVTYPSNTESLDFSDTPLEGVEELEAALAYLPELQTLELHNCGIDNEVLAAYRERQAENYKVIWTISTGWGMYIRTDAKTFMPVMMNQGTGVVWDHSLVDLKYCNEMECVDVGHMPISHCDWAAYMPNLKYLIVGDTGIQSIEGLRGLQNLIYLESFTTPLTDYSPLLETPNLKDLNMVNSRGDPNVIAQITSLERLWWGDGGSYNVVLTNADKQMIREALPNAECQLGVLNPTSLGWRKGKLYYEMRDVLGMPYFGQ